MHRFPAGAVTVILAVMCLGQGCPGPSATEASRGIEQGVYSGQSTCNSVQILYGADGGELQRQQSPPASSPMDAEFGASGALLTAQDSDIAPGDFIAFNLGPFAVRTVATSITSDESRFVVLEDADLTIDDGTQTVTLTGVRRRTYTQRGDGGVDVIATMDVVSPVVDGETLYVQQNCSATLY